MLQIFLVFFNTFLCLWCWYPWIADGGLTESTYHRGSRGLLYISINILSVFYMSKKHTGLQGVLVSKKSLVIRLVDAISPSPIIPQLADTERDIPLPTWNNVLVLQGSAWQIQASPLESWVFQRSENDVVNVQNCARLCQNSTPPTPR